MHSRAAILSCLVALAWCRGEARAVEAEPGAYQPPDFVLQPPTLPPESGVGAVRRLSVADAIALAVRNNLGVVLAKTQLDIARVNIREARGSFEPTLTAGYAHRSARTPPESPFDSDRLNELYEFESDEWRVGYEQRTTIGATLGLEFVNSRNESSLITTQPYWHRSGVELRLTQPLLRGFAFDTDVVRAEVLRAEFATERAKRDVEAAVLTLVRDTEQAYWNLFQALKSYEVQQGAARLANDQLELTRRQIDSGVRPPSDLINAEGTLASRELELVRAENVSQERMDQLRFLLNLPKAEWSQPLLPLDPPRFDELALDLDTALAEALAHRPEVSQREIDIARANLDARVAKVNRLPALDASVSYGLVGQRREYGEALGELPTLDARVWSAGVNFRWTPFNQAASAELEARELGQRAAHTQREAQELALRLELRAALRDLATAARSVRVAGKFRSLAERSLDAEQRRFMNGTSDNFYVAQRQSDLASARLSEIAALVQHLQAAIGLSAAMGVLLRERHVLLDVRDP